MKYYINYTSDSPIYIQFYNERTYFKYNKKDFPIILYGKNNEYFIEIDISDYEIGEYILLHTFHGVDYYIKYQYKKDFRQNNFINLEINEGFNYIPIKKTINDSSLILSIKYKRILTNLLSILNIVKDHVIEIDSNFDFNSTVKGPKFLFLDIYKFNNLRSFAIESNKKFAFFEFAEENKFHLERKEYNNFYLSRQNGENPLLYKRGFIYLNSTDNWQLTIKKLNFSIIEKLYNDPGQEYLDLCHGEEPKTELYYYKSNYYFLEFFTPVLGNFDSFIMDERDVKTLSDFDFNKINETNVFMGEYQTGFFKIVCKKPTLIKHSYVDRSYVGSTIYSGHNYFLINRKSISFDISDLLKGNIITFRFSIVGAKNNYQAELNLNGTKYTLGKNSINFELEYSNQTESYFINFKKGDIKEEILLEIIVGIKVDIKDLQIKNLNESFGSLNLGRKRVEIIKIPKEYDENSYNFLIIQNELDYQFRYNIDIYYGKIEFISIFDYFDKFYEFSHIVPFFTNPYSYIPDNCEKSEEKFFYIILTNYRFLDKSILIKKSKLFTDINLKKINTFPKLKEEDEKYYYKIALPNGDYDSLLIQINRNHNNTFSLSKDNEIYPLHSIYYTNFYTLYKIKKGMLKKNTYLNYYGNSFSDGYANFIPINGSIPNQIDDYFSFNLSITQKEKTNKLNINLKSYSFYIKKPIIII